MPSIDPEEIFDRTFYAIEPHAAYISLGVEGEGYYFLDVAVLEALAWLCLNVAMPVLTGVGSSLMYDRVKRRDKQQGETRVLAISKADIEAIKAEVLETFRNEGQVALPQSGPGRTDAAVAELLRENGLPADVAQETARKIVKEIMRP
jgi:hypothetical protein